MLLTSNTETLEKNEEKIGQMFNGIAGSYDFLNHFFSFGIDKYWRNVTVNSLKKSPHSVVLDLATGTADMAINIANKLDSEKIIGVDISEEMLAIGKKKVFKLNLSHRIELKIGSALALPFENDTFDAVTIGFGIRNFSDVDAGLKEINRVLRKGGSLNILEFSKPENIIIRNIYNLYFSKILPFIGNSISRHKYAYSYLNKSVFEFPSGNEFNMILNKNGFLNVKNRPLTFGIATLYNSNK